MRKGVEEIARMRQDRTPVFPCTVCRRTHKQEVAEMNEGLSEGNKTFYDDQFRIVEGYCKVYNISPEEMPFLVYKKTIGEIDEDKKREFVIKILMVNLTIDF